MVRDGEGWRGAGQGGSDGAKSQELLGRRTGWPGVGLGGMGGEGLPFGETFLLLTKQCTGVLKIQVKNNPGIHNNYSRMGKRNLFMKNCNLSLTMNLIHDALTRPKLTSSRS